MPVKHLKNAGGFTLMELVLGIVVFAIAMSLFISLIVPQARQSADPILQVRASELAQSLMSEIASKSFDENSARGGGTGRCNEAPNPDCTASNDIGEDIGEDDARSIYNDIDDYDALDQSGIEILNSLGNPMSLDGTSSLYEGFRARVTVFYDDDMDGINDAISKGATYTGNNKLIRITVTTPTGEDIVFSSYRSNY